MKSIFEVMIYDLHSGRLSDLEDAYQSKIKLIILELTKIELDTEKILIIITSVLTWGASPPKMVPDKPPVQLDENGEPLPEKTEEELEKEEELKFEEENKRRIEEGLPALVKKFIFGDYDWEDVEFGDDGLEIKHEVQPVIGEDGVEIPVKPIKWIYKDFDVEYEGNDGIEIIKVKRKGKKKIIIK